MPNLPDFTGAVIAFDFETTGINPWTGDEAFACGLCNEEGETWYTEWPVDPHTRRVTPNPEEVAVIRRLLEDPKIVKVAHNLKFDWRFADKQLGIRIQGEKHDTMLAARITNTAEPSVGLKQLAKKYVKLDDDDEKALKAAITVARREGRKRGYLLLPTDSPDKSGDMWLPRHLDPDNRLCEIYCRRDVERTMLLWHLYQRAMRPDRQNVLHTYLSELELLELVYRMETRGVGIDRSRTETLLAEKRKRQEQLLLDMCGIAGVEFNPRSVKQLEAIIYGSTEEGGLSLECFRKTATGRPSTDWKALLPHKTSSQFIDALFNYRACGKAIEMLEKYLALMVPDHDGGWAVHPNFRQDGTVTGRFSASNPNLQQAAKDNNRRSSEPMMVRAPFGPRPGYVWYAVDYSQMELVAFGELANEPVILNAYAEGKDLHSELADRAWGGKDNLVGLRALEQTLKTFGSSEDARALMEQHGWSIVAAEKSLGKKAARDRAKTIMYAKLFGGGPRSVVDELVC